MFSRCGAVVKKWKAKCHMTRQIRVRGWFTKPSQCVTWRYGGIKMDYKALYDIWTWTVPQSLNKKIANEYFLFSSEIKFSVNYIITSYKRQLRCCGQTQNRVIVSHSVCCSCLVELNVSQTFLLLLLILTLAPITSYTEQMKERFILFNRVPFWPWNYFIFVMMYKLPFI